MQSAQIAIRIEQLRAGHRPFCVVTIGQTAPELTHQVIVLFAHGDNKRPTIEGQIGSRRLQNVIVETSCRCIRSGEPSRLKLAPADMDRQNQQPDGAEDTPWIEVIVEPVLSYARLIVFGDSAIAQALPVVATTIEIDALRVGLNHAGQIVARDEHQTPVLVQARDSVVVAMQGHDDHTALTLALQSAAGYVGVIGGSRRKIAFLTDRLTDVIVADRLASLHVPAGLDIEAVAPGEIALSIIAEVIAYRRQPN